MTTMRSDIVSASSWSCVTMMVVMPRRRWRSRISPRRRALTRASSAESGSSSRSRPGDRAQRAGERDALLLAAGELRRVFLRLVGEADQRQELGDARGDLLAGPPDGDEAVGDVVADLQVGKERVGLEDDAEIALADRQAGDVPPGLADRPGRLHVEAGDGAQQRRLSAARRTEERDELAALDVEVDVFERGERAEALGEAADLQIGFGVAGVALSIWLLAVEPSLGALPGKAPPRRRSLEGRR